MNSTKRLQAKLPRFLNVTIGVIVLVIAIVLSPVIALLNPQWKYLWREIVNQFGLWADAVKIICVGAVKHNSWFKA